MQLKRTEICYRWDIVYYALQTDNNSPVSSQLFMRFKRTRIRLKLRLPDEKALPLRLSNDFSITHFDHSMTQSGKSAKKLVTNR